MFPLTSLHSFGLVASASAYTQLNHYADALSLAKASDPGAIWVLGGGSNCVFIQDYHGKIVHQCSTGKELRQDEQYYYVSAEAGENWHGLVQWCLHKGVYGFENLALIPGTVGAAPIQNIGAYGVEIDCFIESVEYLVLGSGDHCVISRQDCEFGYRDSVFKHVLSGKTLITQVNFKLPKAWRPVTEYAELAELDSPDAWDIYQRIVAVRQAKLPDPSVLGNAGSFFKNPVISMLQYSRLQKGWPDLPCYVIDEQHCKVPAAWLIDQLGFKAARVGDVSCHQLQPLVLVNNGGGTGEQLLELARRIKHQVWQTYQIELESEVRLVGENGLISL